MKTTVFLFQETTLDSFIGCLFDSQYIFHFVKKASSGDKLILYLTVWCSLKG